MRRQIGEIQCRRDLGPVGVLKEELGNGCLNDAFICMKTHLTACSRFPQVAVFLLVQHVTRRVMCFSGTLGPSSILGGRTIPPISDSLRESNSLKEEFLHRLNSTAISYKIRAAISRAPKNARTRAELTEFEQSHGKGCFTRGNK
jgi:hypothetical protein